MYARLGLAGLGLAAAFGAGLAWGQTLRPVPEPVALVPDRTDAAELARAEADPLANRARIVLQQSPNAAPILEQAEASPTPVLAPASPALLQTARLYVVGPRYTLVVRENGRLIEIHGTTQAFEAPGASPALTDGDADAPEGGGSLIERATEGLRERLGRAAPINRPPARTPASPLENVMSEETEYGADVSFTRFGAVYNVTFVCDAPDAPECSESAVRTFSEQLQVIGGGAQ